MKYIYSFLIVIVLFSCSNFDETLKGDFTNFKNITPSDFNTDFPVINLVVDQDEFDNMYSDFEEDIEIEGFLNLYRKNILLISEELVEIEVKGNFSATFNLKSLGIKFDDAYNNEDKSLLNPKITLPNHSLDEVKAFRLRNSGNDYRETMIKDISYTQLAINAGLDLDLTYYEPALVFVNNTFLGVMNIRSEANTNGVSRLNDTKKKNITLAKINFPNELEKKDGDFDRIDAFIEAIKNEDLTYLKSEVDIANFIDYIIFQTYIANVDWPYNNVRFYAVEEEPFRFVVFDLDWVNTKDIKSHPLDFIRKPKKVSTNESIDNHITDLFNVLYSDVDFKTQFDSRYMELVAENVFSVENFNTIVDQNYTVINSYMPYQVSKYDDIGTMVEWYQNIELLKENFKKRGEEVKEMSPLF